MKKPLLWAFLTGAALTLVIRLALPNLGGAIAAALAAVAIVWWLGSYYTANKVKQRDRAGDDLYYLGLLLTLISMIYALVSLFTLPDAGDVQARVDALIGNFGIALISTVAGILGRILLQDASGALPDSTDTASQNDAGRLAAEQREALTTMQQLRQQLREASDAFAHFTRITLSHADHTKSHTERLLEDFNQHMAAVAERGLDDTGVAWQRVGEAMRKDGEGLLGRIEEVVSGAAERTEGTWRSLVRQIESASMAAHDRLQADADEIAQTLTQLKTANDSLSLLATALDDVQRHVSTLAEKASRASSALDANVTEAIAAQKTLLEGTKASQAAALQSFEAAAKALTGAVDQHVAEQTQAWQRAANDFNASGQTHREQTKRAMVDTQQAIDTMISGLQAAVRDIASLGQSASRTAAALESHTVLVSEKPNALAISVAERQERNIQAPHEAAFDSRDQIQLAQKTDVGRGPGDDFTRPQGAPRQRDEGNAHKTQPTSGPTSAEASPRPTNLVDRLLRPFDRRH